MAPAGTKGRGSWRSEALKALIARAFSSAGEGRVVVVSLPPGAGKTWTMAELIVENKLSAVMAFPTHQNQRTALKYLLKLHEGRKLNHYIVDYAGLENYCIFYRPKLLMRFLDRFRGEGEKYVDAVESMLGHPAVFEKLMALDVGDSSADELWRHVARLLDDYARTGDAKRYLEGIRELIAEKSQGEVCKRMCPVGLFAYWFRRDVRKALAKPAVITWRRDLAEGQKAQGEGKRGRISIVCANPERFVERFDEVAESAPGEVDPTLFLCPRLLLVSHLVPSKKKQRPVNIAVKRAIILTPHAGLDFVLSTVARHVSASGVAKRYFLFVDEYDAMLRPATWNVVSIKDAEAEVAVAEQILEAGIGERVRGVLVDEYLFRYAKYVRDVLGAVVDLFHRATETGSYHPIVNVFVEGALSKYREETVKTAVPVEYLPLGARVVHIKHMLGDGGRLLALILNPALYFEDLRRTDVAWRIRLRTAAVRFKRILSKGRTHSRVLVPARNGRGGIVVYPVTRPAAPAEVLEVLRDYLSPLRVAPRYAVFYTGEPSNGLYAIRLASVDARLYVLIGWSPHAVFASATPVDWVAYVAGPNLAGVATSEYERVVRDISHSLVFFERTATRTFEDREETEYAATMSVYSQEFAESKLPGLLGRGQETAFSPDDVKKVTIPVLHVSHWSTRKYVAELADIVFLETLRPITQARALLPKTIRGRERDVAVLRNYLDVLGALTRSGRTVLVLAQNKSVALALKEMLSAVPCVGERCGPDVPVEKASHFKAGDVAITYFRSRATRGIDLPIDFDAVLVVGSPFPRPTVLSRFRSDSGGSPLEAKHYVTLTFVGYTVSAFTAYKSLVGRDFAFGVAELIQALGRATRSAMRRGRRVTVFVPAFLRAKVLLLSPPWFRVPATAGHT